jgi:hypothetical protein
VHTDLSQLCKVEQFDPLLYETALPYRRTLYPLGFAAVIATNDKSVVRAAESVWGRFEKAYDAPAVELRIAVSESSTAKRPSARMPRAQGHLISYVHDADNFVHIDVRAGFAFGWLTNAVADDLYYLRYHFVEPCLSLMIESMHLATLHAACVALNGKAVLLSGDTQAGKSTMAYACARRGWDYLCDDGSHMIRRSDSRVILGNPYQIRFRPHSRSLFPELSGYVPFDRPNGKPSIELDTALLNISIAHSAEAECVVFLNRTAEASWQGLTACDQEEAFDRLTEFVCLGDECLREEQRNSIRRLLSVPVYDMQYYDLDWAEQRLRALVEGDE